MEQVEGWVGTVGLMETGSGGIETAQPAAYLVAIDDHAELLEHRRLGWY